MSAQHEGHQPCRPVRWTGSGAELAFLSDVTSMRRRGASDELNAVKSPLWGAARRIAAVVSTGYQPRAILDLIAPEYGFSI
jgi:hypothetical protein